MDGPWKSLACRTKTRFSWPLSLLVHSVLTAAMQYSTAAYSCCIRTLYRTFIRRPHVVFLLLAIDDTGVVLVTQDMTHGAVIGCICAFVARWLMEYGVVTGGAGYFCAIFLVVR